MGICSGQTAGLSSTGFSVKRLDEIIASLKASAVTKFSPSLGVGDVLDLTDNSVLGRWISIVGLSVMLF